MSDRPPPKKRRKTQEPQRVVRRSAADRKRLPPELEEFARSDDKRLRPRRSYKPRLRDPRAVALVPGVKNADARAIFEARLSNLTDLGWAAADGAAGAVAAHERALAEAVLLGVWRGRSLTSFDAFVEGLLELKADEARAAAERGAEAMGVPCEAASEEFVAVWMRAESALRDAGLGGVVTVADGEPETLRFDLPVETAPEALDQMGRRMGSLVADRAEEADQGARPRGDRPDRGSDRGGRPDRPDRSDRSNRDDD